ncbi:MAG: energy transducer TonB [Bacteroidales bacterium]|nr:energy transducer TonB [Bacteroidales bacterium]MCF8352482.1 energy transducer TonB [Bacteroidales bacterium]MCF8376389.1 energy transducer TonB [Bacteroidales bacterium]MCF8401227.1 energy transducer TonB [Bacteroidales bacterium]
MEKKKTKRADLENKRTIFLQIGLVVVLAAIFVAFEAKTYQKKEKVVFQVEDKELVQEEIIQTKQEVKPEPPPPPKQVTRIEIVEDDIEIEDEIEIDVEADMETEIEEFVPVEMEEETGAEEMEIFTVVESMPEFPGGEAKLYKYLADNIEYPQLANESGIQGRVFVTFVVERNGEITDVRVLRGIGGGCDEEAVRVVQSMPRWKPGKQRGKPVRVQYNLPIKFTLQ